MPNQINLRTSDAQHQFWTSFATARSLPLATWIKKVLDRESGFIKKPILPKPIPAPKP